MRTNKTTSKAKGQRNELLTLLLVFITIVGLFAMIQGLAGLYPFGNTSNLLWDEDIQYVDYFSFYRDVLLGRASLGYSFSKSLGGSLVALFGYYLGCPLNLFVVFFKTEQLPMFIFLLTAVKLGLSGVTAEIFFGRRFPSLSLYMKVLLSVSYGLMQYSMIQLSNIMWLDGVILLPLLLLAVYRFVSENKKTGLFLAVLFSIAINWYTGYMTGLFAVLYFLYERILKSKKLNGREVKAIFIDTIRCGIIMVTGVLGSCFIFYPVMKGLQKGKSVFDIHIFNFDTYDSFIDVFRGFTLGSVIPTVALYCGLLFLGFFIYFFCSGRIPVKEKILSGLAVLFMFASCWLVTLDCIWSGMRFVASYRFRYSFVVVFLVLFLAARGAEAYEWQNDRKKMAIIFGICIAGLLLFQLKGASDKNGAFLTLVVLIVYIVLFLTARYQRIFKTAVPVLLAAELVMNGVLTFKINYEANPDISVYQNYAKQSRKQVKALKEKEKDTVFYRMDTLEKRYGDDSRQSAILNESMVYGYHGLNHYSSTFDSNISKMLYDIGYSTSEDLSIVVESILPADSLYGIRYLSSQFSVPGYEKETAIPVQNGKAVYYNPYALGLGILAADSVYETADSEDPFEYQNQLFSNILGRRVDLYKKADYNISLADNTLSFVLPAGHDANLVYGYVDSEIEDLALNIDGTYKGNYACWLGHKIFYAGENSADHVVSLSSYWGTTEAMTPYFYYLDQSLFEDIIDELKNTEMKTDVWKDGEIKGSCTAQSNTNLLLSVPYDEGWTAQVNGKDVKVKEGANALTVVSLEAGENTIQLKYHIPGLLGGIILTFAGIVLFTLFSIIEKRRTKKHES